MSPFKTVALMLCFLYLAKQVDAAVGRSSVIPYAYQCRLFKDRVSSIGGCTPAAPVYKTRCSGFCYSSTQTDPAHIPPFVSRWNYCCQPSRTKTFSVKLNCPSSKKIRMAVTCDNSMKVYFDGKLQYAPSYQLNNWKLASTFWVPGNTKLVAIECRDHGVVGGILADGVKTDSSWECSSKYVPGWNNPGHPSHLTRWPSAYEIGYNGMPPWGKISGISTRSKLIWTTGWKGQHKTVYCRKRLDRTHKYTAIERCGCLSC